MVTRRHALLGAAASAAGWVLAAHGADAWHVEEMPPDLENALDAACGAGGDSHAALIATGRLDLVRRIAQGLLPAGASETLACPICGCQVVVSVGDAP